MSWAELSLQPVVSRLLKRTVTSGRISHAYLFSGSDPDSKNKAAQLLAQALNCDEGQPCGRCQSCRLVAAQTHPDVQFFEPEGRFWRLNQIRALCLKAGRTALRGRTKVYVIAQADRLLPESANHLLKMLEEPPEATVFVLLSERAEALMPTVASRCQEVRFRAVGPAELARRLTTAGAPEDQAHLAARLAQGDENTAAGWLEDEAASLVDGFVEAAADLPTGQGAVFEAAGLFSGQPEKYLPLLEAWYRDLMVFQAGEGQELYFLGREQQLKEAAGRYRTPQLAKMCLKIDETRQLLASRINVHGRLALEALLTELAADE